jgi:hypothetical protein
MRAPLTAFLLIRGVRVGRGGVESPTFRFSEVAISLVTPGRRGQAVPDVCRWVWLVADVVVKVAVTFDSVGLGLSIAGGTARWGPGRLPTRSRLAGWAPGVFRR